MTPKYHENDPLFGPKIPHNLTQNALFGPLLHKVDTLLDGSKMTQNVAKWLINGGVSAIGRVNLVIVLPILILPSGPSRPKARDA